MHCVLCLLKWRDLIQEDTFGAVLVACLLVAALFIRATQAVNIAVCVSSISSSPQRLGLHPPARE